MSARYIPELDGLRALAAIAVVAFHTKLPPFSGGFLGVDVFFVLSGYLTASIALSGKYDFKEFMVRRFRRLWPLLVFVCVGIAISMAIFGDISAREVLPGAVFLSNFSIVFFGIKGPLGHTWTLANEMQFYALVAVLAITLPRTTFRQACIVLFFATTCIRIRFMFLGDFDLGYYSPIAHSSGLFAGAAIATLSLDQIRRTTFLFVISAVAILAAFVLAKFKTFDALLLWISVVELGTVGLIVAIISGTGSVAALLRTRAMRSLGVLSYGIYLWHFPIAVVLREEFDPATAFVLTFSASLLLAMLSYHFIEQPMRTSFGRRTAPSS